MNEKQTFLNTQVLTTEVSVQEANGVLSMLMCKNRCNSDALQALS